jgi:hypothetical protein
MLIICILFFFAKALSQSSYTRLDAIHLRSDIALPGRVLTNDDAFKLLEREAQLTFQQNLPKYLQEFRNTGELKKVDFTEYDFAVVGSLATFDAAITFTEGIQNIHVVRRDQAAGFSGLPNPSNDKLHSAVQRLNAARNIVQLIKDKLKNGVVRPDQSLLEKLKEAQTWLSTQTGGHLGSGMKFALKKSGVIRSLQAKWGGATSLKFRSFDAGVSNGLDFLINGYNTVVNSLSVGKEASVPNILALTSSITAMAGDIAMGVGQVLSDAAVKASIIAGPVAYGLAATFYMVSYGTSVAQGFTSQENLEPKDYVKIFLSPLVPDPTFGTTVDIIDSFAKGNYLEGYYLFLSQSFPAALVIAGKAIVDKVTGSSYLDRYLTIMNFFRVLVHYDKMEKFKANVKKELLATVRQLKPNKVSFVYPEYNRHDRYVVEGWESDNIKEEFQISGELTPIQLFIATYSNQTARPSVCPEEAEKGFTFCPTASPHQDDRLVFLGSDNVNDKVILDDNCEAYGMGGNDHFVLKAAVVRKGVRINGGEGNDIIDITNTFYGSSSSVTGGGPERDVIKTGPGNDTILVDNDDVEVTNGDNTLLVQGKGSDDIRLGTGSDLVIVEKTGGSISITRIAKNNRRPEQNKPKRIVYKGYERIKDSDKTDFIEGSPTQFDLLRLRKYCPNFQQHDHERLLLFQFETKIDDYVHEVGRVISDLFKGHGFEVERMRSKAQIIQFMFMERFELSESAINMLLLKNGRSDYYEVTGGHKHDFVVNLDRRSTPLSAQMSTGDNRILSGRGADNYSVILDDGVDVIYDKGGDNILAIQLPLGKNLNDAKISKNSNNLGYKIDIEARPRDHRIEFNFWGRKENGGSVKIIVQDSTGKQITFKPVSRPNKAENNPFSRERSVGRYYYDKFEYCPGDQDVLTIVEGISPEIGKTLPRPHCRKSKHSFDQAN